MHEKKNSVALEKARTYEETYQNLIPKGQKPTFHVCAPIGWINDPNGFSIYKEEYHLFYQYYPYGTKWGPMHWGHSKTRDFIRWEQLPAALAPDSAYDIQGCFSGSAITHEGEHILMYTGVREEEQEDGSKLCCQIQCIAVGDGVNYEKLMCNPVIKSDLLPEGSSREDFRDPKIWREGDTFYAVIGSRSADNSGQIALFSSKDLKEWEFLKIIEQCNNKYGLMWECPDFFELDGKQVLLVSPQDMLAEGLEFHSGNCTMYLVGTYEKMGHHFLREEVAAIDYGLDFYAPQTLETSDGRRIMIAWMQSWDNHITPHEFAWSGMMTIPRELHIINGRLYQLPVRELEQYYHNTVSYEGVTVNGPLELGKVRGREIDMTIEVEEGYYSRFRIHVAGNDKYNSLISYNLDANTLTFDRNYSELRRDTLYKRKMYVRNQEGKIKLRVVMDKYSVEIFVNDGEQAMTSLIYTSLDADRIVFYGEGNVKFNIIKHDIVVEE